MDIDLEPGTYMVAVSGGVDSMVLLDLLVQKPELKLVVAHFDHGIRSDSDLDRQLVENVAKSHKLVFVYDRAQLGPTVSEDMARKARYDFLFKLLKATDAKAIITAHHQDDFVETAVHNLFRGTGRKGLTALACNTEIVRPLLHVSKKDLRQYAKINDLVWREDTTNQDIRYRRNYIRHKIIPKLSLAHRARLITILKDMKKLNDDIDSSVASSLRLMETKSGIRRKEFIKLPHPVSLEIMALWLRNHGIRQFNKKLLQKLVSGAKTLAPGKCLDIDASHHLTIKKNFLSLEKHR